MLGRLLLSVGKGALREPLQNWTEGGQDAMPLQTMDKTIKPQLSCYAYRRAGSRCH